MRSKYVSIRVVGVLCVGVLTAAVCLGQSAAGADPGGWTPTPTPNPLTPTGYLNAVSCATPGHCVAVGYYADGQGDVVPLAEASAGAGWVLVPPVVPPGSGLSVLNAITCTAPASCEAVGFYNDPASNVHSFAELYSDGVWTLQNVPPPAGARDAGLLGLDCRSAGDCFAVGNYTDASGASLVLGEHWNGAAWAPQYVPSPGAALASQLDAVSCSAVACTAVGSYRAADGSNVPLAETGGAGGWHEQLMAVPDANVAANLQGVSCDAAGVCIAVGYWTDDMGNGYALTEQRGGPTDSWAVGPTPPVGSAQNPTLAAIACQSATQCTAAGADSSGTLIEQWNGVHWTRQPSGAVPRSGGTGLACPSASSCVVVGYMLGVSKIPVPLIDAFNGVGWQVAPDVPAPDGVITAGLYSVSCSSAGTCTAVGEQTSLNGRTTSVLVARLDGGTWLAQSAPGGLHAQSTSLDAVSCPDDSHCVAAGYDFLRGGSNSVIENWDGSTWTLAAVPTVAGSMGSDLRAVSCTSPTSCMAVGEYSDSSGNTFAMAMQLSGGRWHLRPMPLPAGTAYSTLTGVSCVGSRCTVVGTGGSARGRQIIVVEVWDGTAWTIQHAAVPAGAGGTQLVSVSCPAVPTCTAVGSYVDDRGVQYSLVEKRTGFTWTVQSSPNPDGVVASPLNSVSCSAVASCAAGGNDYALDPNGLPAPAQAYAQTYDGSSWSLQSVDVPPGTGGSSISGISCAGGECVGVGYRFASSGRQVTFAVEG